MTAGRSEYLPSNALHRKNMILNLFLIIMQRDERRSLKFYLRVCYFLYRDIIRLELFVLISLSGSESDKKYLIKKIAQAANSSAKVKYTKFMFYLLLCNLKLLKPGAVNKKEETDSSFLNYQRYLLEIICGINCQCFYFNIITDDASYYYEGYTVYKTENLGGKEF